jgi:hypothetical protein
MHQKRQREQLLHFVRKLHMVPIFNLFSTALLYAQNVKFIGRIFDFPV